MVVLLVFFILVPFYSLDMTCKKCLMVFCPYLIAKCAAKYGLYLAGKGREFLPFLFPNGTQFQNFTDWRAHRFCFPKFRIEPLEFSRYFTSWKCSGCLLTKVCLGYWWSGNPTSSSFLLFCFKRRLPERKWYFVGIQLSEEKEICFSTVLFSTSIAVCHWS